MIPISIVIAIAIIVGCIGFWLGSILNYQRGYTDAWAEADAYEAITDDLADIRWVVTPTGREALEDVSSQQSIVSGNRPPLHACSSPMTNDQ